MSIVINEVMGKHLYWVVLFLPKFMAVSAAFASSQRVLGLHVTLPVGSSVLEALQTHSLIFFSKPRDVWRKSLAVSPIKPYLPKFPKWLAMAASSTWTEKKK